MTAAVLPDPLATALVPRRYQEEIFERACTSNIIAALDTGSGKTFISTLLIKHVTSVCLSGPNGRTNAKVIFLAPKIPLVEQQADFLKRHTTLRVSKRHGSIDIELSDREGWKREWENHDIFVMTPQLLRNALTHSLWSLSEITLLIFDEAHHAQKNHPYASIMREYRELHPLHRPKIFGMTASPVWNTKDPSGSIKALERSLDANVAGVTENLEELASVSSKPVESIRTFPASLTDYNYPSPRLLDLLPYFSLPPDTTLTPGRMERQYNKAWHDLGPYAAEMWLYNLLKDRVHSLKSQGWRADTDATYRSSTDIAVDVNDIDAVRMSMHETAPELKEADELLSSYADFFEREKLPIQKGWCAPKLHALREILLGGSDRFASQGIVFVELRHFTFVLARLLDAIVPGVRAGALLGHGDERGSVSMGVLTQRAVVSNFRNGRCNLVVATSVAEEGLDFPKCDIVVRFDPVETMVGYLQSRGRARNKTSRFIIMVPENDTAYVERYRALVASEPSLKDAYQRRHRDLDGDSFDDGDDGYGDTIDPSDLAKRERYVVKETGAVLTYDSALGLLAQLLAIVPRDTWTRPPKLVFEGTTQQTVILPRALPLPDPVRIFIGPLRASQKEARRAVAFTAVRALHRLGVFTEYLLPRIGKKFVDRDADGRALGNWANVGSMLTVGVVDPFVVPGSDSGHAANWYLTVVQIDGRRDAGIITCSALPPVALVCGSSVVRTRASRRVAIGEKVVTLMEEYMRLAVFYCNTGRPITDPFSLFLVPLTEDSLPDYQAMRRLVYRPRGTTDWSGVDAGDTQWRLIMNWQELGRSLIFKRIRSDLTVASVPPPDSRESKFATYREYFVDRWTRTTYEKLGRDAFVPEDCPLIEVQVVKKTVSGRYDQRRSTHRSAPYLDEGHMATKVPKEDVRLAPRDCCAILDISEGMFHAFSILPPLARHVVNVYRVHRARIDLGLPRIWPSLLIEALTIPHSSLWFSNQRLETLGDAVLKLGVTVHLFNKFPHRHEGQLDDLRRLSIANKTLLARAREVGLDRFIITECLNIGNWRYVLLPSTGKSADRGRMVRTVPREYARRSLQDCMEATLGAAYLSGGIPMALQAGSALGLGFGGSLPWTLRYSRNPMVSPVAPLFNKLQEDLGYEFWRGEFILEAVTHPTFTDTRPSYQRLEFLGDAVIDLVVAEYLWKKFPKATPGQITWARSRAVCNLGLAAIAVRRLELHRIILINNVELSMVIADHVPLLESLTPRDIVAKGWKWDPPKAISDAFEAVVGAVFVDSGWNFDVAQAVVLEIMSDVLDVLTPNLPLDPISELMVFLSKAGCRAVKFQKSKSNPELSGFDGVAVLVHEAVVAGPFRGRSIMVTKGLVSERALAVLQDPGSDECLSRLCTCEGRKWPAEPAIDAQPALSDAFVAVSQPPDSAPEAQTAEVEFEFGMDVDEDHNVDNESENDETEEGFAAMALDALEAVEGPQMLEDDDETNGADDGIREEDESEVIRMLVEPDEEAMAHHPRYRRKG